MGGPPLLLAMNGGGGGGGRAILYSMCTMRALQVDRLQRRRDLAAAEDREAQ